MKTAGQVRSVWQTGAISFQAAHTALRAIGYTDGEADDILLLHTINRLPPSAAKRRLVKVYRAAEKLRD